MPNASFLSILFFLLKLTLAFFLVFIVGIGLIYLGLKYLIKRWVQTHAKMEAKKSRRFRKSEEIEDTFYGPFGKQKN